MSCGFHSDFFSVCGDQRGLWEGAAWGPLADHWGRRPCVQARGRDAQAGQQVTPRATAPPLPHPTVQVRGPRAEPLQDSNSRLNPGSTAYGLLGQVARLEESPRLPICKVEPRVARGPRAGSLRPCSPHEAPDLRGPRLTLTAGFPETGAFLSRLTVPRTQASQMPGHGRRASVSPWAPATNSGPA